MVYVLGLPLDTQDPSSFEPEVRRRMEEGARARLEEEVERRLLEEVLRPWHAADAEWAKVERAHPEEQQRVELEAL